MAESNNGGEFNPSLVSTEGNQNITTPKEWERRQKAESTNYDEKLEFAYEMQNTSPEISDLSKHIGADSLFNQYKAIQDIDQNLLNTDPAYARYRNFQIIVDGLYREKNEGKSIETIANDDKALSRFMNSLMTEKNGGGERNALLALKIAESQMALLEATTGVHTFVDCPPEPRDFTATPDAFTPENDDEQDQRFLQDEDLKTNRGGMFNRFKMWVRNIPVVDRANDLVRKVQGAAQNKLDYEASKRTQAVATIEFCKRPWQPDGDVHRLSVYKQLPDGTKIPVTINGKPIDKVQGAYLRRMQSLGVIAPGEPLTAKAKASVVREVRRINKMRMNVYAHMGMDLVDDYDFNMLHTDPWHPGSPDHMYNQRVDTQSIVVDSFGIPKINGKSVEIAVGAGGVGLDLDTQIEALQGGFRERVNELVKKNRPAEVLRAVNDQVAALEEEAKKHRDPDRVNGIDKEEIPRYQELTTYFSERKRLEKEKSDLTNEEHVLTQRLKDPSGIQDAQGRDVSHQEILLVYRSAQQKIDTAQSAVNALNETITSTEKALEPDKNRLSKLQDELVAIGGQLGSKSISQDNKDILNARRSELIRRINGGAEVLDSNGNVISPAIQGLLPKVEAMEAARDAAIRDRIAKDAQLQAEKNAFENLKSAIPESKYITAKKFSDDRDALRVQSDVKYTEIVNLERGAATKLLKDPTDPSKGTWTEAEVKEKLGALALEKELAQKPERNIERKLNAYKELQAILKPEELQNVYERARESVYSPHFKQALTEAVKAHGELPPGYLATIIKIYGPDITLPGKKEEFKKATTWLTPEMFVDTLRQSYLPVDSVYDSVLRTEDVANMIDGEFVNAILDKAMTEARAGRLGERPAEETQALNIIDKTPATNLETHRTENTQVVESAISSLQHSVPLAEARIHLQKIPALSTMNRQQLYPYIDTFRNVYNVQPPNVPPVPTDATESEMLQHFSSVHTNVPQDQAQEIVHTLYGLYNRGSVAESAYHVVMRSRKDTDMAVELGAAAMLIDNTEDQEQFLSRVENDESLTMICDSLRKLPPQDRPPYYDSISRLARHLKQLYTSNPNATRQDVSQVIENSMYEHKQRTLGARANMPDIFKELGEQVRVLDALYDKESTELFIDQMDMTIYYANDASELALRMMKHLGVSYNNPDTVRYHKMVAEEIMRRRRMT